MTSSNVGLNLTDLLVALPEIFLMSMVVVILLFESLSKESKHSTLYALSLIAIIGTGILGVYQYMADFGAVAGNAFWYGEIIHTPLIGFLKLVLVAIVGFGFVYSYPRLAAVDLANAEYYVLTLLSTLGMLVLISAGSVLTLYIGLELMSLPMYGLVALNRKSKKGSEAAIKYFVMGAMASGILLYGMALLYGATGSLRFADLGVTVEELSFAGENRLLLFSVVFLIVGTVFKLGAAPFHSWVPDVYEGAPAPVAMFVGAAPKIAAFMMGVLLLHNVGFSLADKWKPLLAAIAIISFVLGNLIALKQENLRRMLGYSAVSHAGFILLGLFVSVVDSTDLSAGLFYAITYALTTVAAFGFILSVSNNGRGIQKIDELKGFAREHGWYALLMSGAMLSMGGIPIFVGFHAKLLVLKTAFEAGFIFTVIIGLLMSVIGLFYYLRVIKVMFFDEPEATQNLEVNVTTGSTILFTVNGLALVLLGIAPSLLLMFF